MGRLIYTAIASLDGYVADVDGNWDWAVPDAEVHAAINAQEAAAGTYLLGRRLYEVLVAWETYPEPGSTGPEADYAEIWRAAEKIVYSRSLSGVAGGRTRIEREFDASAVAEMVARSGHDVSIGGPELAGVALSAGIVDEINLYLSPVIVGGGKPALPAGGRLDLELGGERRFANGVIHLNYGVRR